AIVFIGILLAGLFVTSQRYALSATGGPLGVETGPLGAGADWDTGPYGWHMEWDFAHSFKWSAYFWMPQINRRDTRIFVLVPWCLLGSAYTLTVLALWRLTRRRKVMAAFPVETIGSK